MTRLSIIIPALRDTGLLEETLVSVLEHRPADCEVMVPHPGTYSDPYDLSDEVQFLELPAGTGRAGCIQAAMHFAKAKLVHVVGCGVKVQEGWTDRVLRHFEDPSVAAVTPLVLNAASPTNVLNAGVSSPRAGRRVVHGNGAKVKSAGHYGAKALGPSMLAGFYRKSAVAEVGGYPLEVGDVQADIDLALSLAEAGYSTRFEAASQLLAAPDCGDKEHPYAAALHGSRIRWRHSDEQPAKSHKLRLMLQALLRCYNPPAAIARLMGELAGLKEIAQHRQFRAMLADLARSQPEAVTTLAIPAREPSQRRAA